MKNKKGFTLIELLAVIVILGVLLGIAIPKVTQYINNSKKESFISFGKLFVDSVRNDATSETYLLPINSNDVTIVTLDMANMNKTEEKSPFGGKYIYNKSYVVIINAGTGVDPEYEYYFAVQDSKDYAIPLTKETELNSEKIVAKAKNKMEVTVQALCGTKTGTTITIPTISGLDNIQPKDEAGNKISWNATVYSIDGCGINEE